MANDRWRRAGSLVMTTAVTGLLPVTPAVCAPAKRGPAAVTVTRLEVSPPSVRLYGPDAVDQVYVTARLSDGTVKDVTGAAVLKAAGPNVRTGAGGEIRARKEGAAQVAVLYGGRKATLPVTVSGADRSRPVSFVYDVLPIMSRAGCNQGSCHGNAEGRGGFRISLKGEDPTRDYAIIAQHGGGRRINRADPGRSLLLLKAVSSVPHGGGRRFAETSEEYRVLARWIAEGAALDGPDAPRLVGLQVSPRQSVLVEPARIQRLTVLGRFTDGSLRNLSRRVVYSPGDPSVTVTPEGLVQFENPADMAVLVRYADQIQNVRLTYVPARKEFAWKAVPAANWIDEINFRRLKELRLQPSDLAGDSEYLRRAYVDAIGTLPTADETRAFLADGSPDKRKRLVESLLQRPELADVWAMRWSDVLRIEERTLDPKGAAAYRDWIRGWIRDGKPLDEFARQLLTATGSTYANPPANYYRRSRTADDLAETTAQVFMGTRMLCAKCHNHPFERWKQDDYYTLAAFFARVDRKIENLTRKDKFDLHELVGEETISVAAKGAVKHPRTDRPVAPGLPGWLPPVPVVLASAPAPPDPRVAFAQWLTGPRNPFFARAVVNRIWYHLMGRGIVDPVDDLRESNPPANPELLDALAKDFIEHGYDLRHTVRTIMNSRTYQLSSLPNRTNAADERFFSRAIPVRLPAEVLLDAISQVTESPEELAANADRRRAINLIPVNKQKHPFLALFGQPARESACECERTNETTLGQSFALISGGGINGKLKRPENRIGRLIAAGKPDPEIITEFYLAAVSREPTSQELDGTVRYVRSRQDRRAALEDVLWALLNSKEFLLRR